MERAIQGQEFLAQGNRAPQTHTPFRGYEQQPNGSFNGNTLRMREKVVRGIKKVDSAIISGMQIHHNFIRPHQGLDGDTPADRAGIKIQGNNKWKTIIQNASKADLLTLSK